MLEWDDENLYGSATGGDFFIPPHSSKNKFLVQAVHKMNFTTLTLGVLKTSLDKFKVLEAQSSLFSLSDDLRLQERYSNSEKGSEEKGAEDYKQWNKPTKRRKEKQRQPLFLKPWMNI